MNTIAQAGMLRRLRCLDCKRAPTEAEVKEMVAVFGHKLSKGDGPKLRWRCHACGGQASS